VEPADLGYGLSAFGATVSGESDLRGLLTFLDRIESTEKMVRIKELTIHGLRAGELPLPTKPESLDFEITISGLMLGSADGSTDTARVDSARAHNSALHSLSPAALVARADR
jgi:hypothetical protein